MLGIHANMGRMAASPNSNEGRWPPISDVSIFEISRLVI